ncbi:MAG: LysM peptidoglycan-binding domain-containing protein [Microscillaceae bacterium]|nr:LysM peptidoglycan-binding domain-containing protein [Microscillaceae bacterium]MDW8460242.1 LysM peptidoglycan-binding domain-containing protein [Cytophagales bacterium]
MTYTVQQGDSLFAIARKFNTTVEHIRALNNLTSNNIQIGQVLKVANTPTITPATTQQLQTTPTSPTPTSTTTQMVRYVVQAGDTLATIARQFGTTIEAIQRTNQLVNDRLQVGQLLNISVQINPKSTVQQQVANPTSDPPTQQTPQSTPTGTISLHRINTAGSNPQVGIQAIIEARKIFQIQVEDGRQLLAHGLKGMVGRHQVNNPEDLQAVQTRLVQLGMLPANHTEAPQQIFERFGKIPITSNYIPQTIAAIERLQREQVSYWTASPSRAALIGTSSFTPGVVANHDATFRILRDFARYHVIFPHPQDNSPVRVQFHNFIRSDFTADVNGISFLGISKPEIPIDVMLRLGLDSRSAKALLYVSKNEGNFDAVNSFDKAIFSWGFIQFAGGNRGLAPLMMLIKQKAPRVFENFFQRFGIDIELNSNTRNLDFVVTNPFAQDGKFIVKGIEAEKLLREDKVLTSVFIRAGHYLPIITLQLEAAINDYVRPALNNRLNITVGSTQMNNLLLSDYIKSELGITLVLDLSISKGVTGGRNLLIQAIQQVATNHALTSPEALRNIDEKVLAEQILTNGKAANDTTIIKRVTNLLNSGMSTSKN